MKLIILALACIALANAFYIVPITSANYQTLADANSDAELSDFNEVEALQQFFQGLVVGATTKNSTDIAFCIKGDGVITLYDYYAGLALAAGTSGATTAVASARKYLNTIGAKQLRSVPADLLSCIEGTNDFKAITQKFGVNPTSDAYGAKFSNFANSNPLYFSSLFTSVYNHLNAGEFHAAGYLFGSYSRIATMGSH